MSDTNRVEDLPTWAQDLVRTLRNEAAEARIKNRDAVDAAVQAEKERLTREFSDKVTSLEGKLTAAESAATGDSKLLNQIRGAIKAGVPANTLLTVAPRLVGSNEDEFAADAKSVAEGFGVKFTEQKHQRQSAIDPTQGLGNDNAAGSDSEADIFAAFLHSSVGWDNN